jgi:hypothetical protein
METTNRIEKAIRKDRNERIKVGETILAAARIYQKSAMKTKIRSLQITGNSTYG